MPANRPATDRTQSLRPLFSWMTSTPPRAFGASAHAAWSSPCGPAQVIGVVVSACVHPRRLALDGGSPGGGHRRVRGGLAVLVAFAAGGDQGGGRRRAYPEQRQPAQGFASGQQAVNVIGGNFFGDIAL